MRRHSQPSLTHLYRTLVYRALGSSAVFVSLIPFFYNKASSSREHYIFSLLHASRELEYWSMSTLRRVVFAVSIQFSLSPWLVPRILYFLSNTWEHTWQPCISHPVWECAFDPSDWSGNHVMRWAASIACGEGSAWIHRFTYKEFLHILTPF